MTLIEGIGDEVTQFFVLLFVIIIGIIAWWSTNISEQPLIRTVLILESRRSHRVISLHPPSGTNTTTPLSNIETTLVVNQENTPSEETPVETNSNEQPKESNQSSSNAANSNTPEGSTNATTLEQPSRSNNEVDVCFSELRQRRVNFLSNRQATLIEPSIDTTATSSENPPSQNSSNSSSGSIRIKLMYLNDDHKLVEGLLQEKLGEFKRRHFSLELAADKQIRLIFNGQVLQSDSETLQGYGLFDNCAVHCLVHSQRSSNPLNDLNRDASNSNNSNANNEGSQHREWDLCNILFISLSLLLGIAWYCRYQYSQLFNWTTTVALIGFTGILTVSFVSIYVPDQERIRLRI